MTTEEIRSLAERIHDLCDESARDDFFNAVEECLDDGEVDSARAVLLTAIDGLIEDHTVSNTVAAQLYQRLDLPPEEAARIRQWAYTQ